MGRSEMESLRPPRVDFRSGKTVHFEITVTEADEEEEEEAISANFLGCVFLCFLSHSPKSSVFPVGD